MRDRLPETIDTGFLQTTGKASFRDYQGELSLRGMTRLAESLQDTDVPDLRVHLKLGRDAGGVCCLEGTLHGVLHLTCQRCLGRMDFPVASAFRLAVVHSEAEAERLAEGYEPLLLEGDRLSVRTVAEDELLLALPNFPQHTAGEECVLPDYRGEEQPAMTDEKPNPFAALASLKRK